MNVANVQACLDQVQDTGLYSLINLFSGGALLQLAVVAVPFPRDVFDTTALTVSGWLLCLSAGLVAPLGIWLASRVGSSERGVRAGGAVADPQRRGR